MVNVTHRDRVERRAAQRNALGSIYRSSVYRRKLCNAGQTDANRRRPSCSINTSVVGWIERVGPSGVSRRDGGSQIACRLQRGPDGNGSRYSGCGERRRGCLWMIYSINLLQLLSLIRGSFSFFFFFYTQEDEQFFLPNRVHLSTDSGVWTNLFLSSPQVTLIANNFFQTDSFWM